MKRRRTGGGDLLPAGVLHVLATGQYLTQEEGEALYGPGFDPWAAWFDVPADLTPHHAAIDAHARWLRAQGISC